MQSSNAVGESPSVGSVHGSADPVNEPAGPSTRKKFVFKALPTTGCGTVTSPRHPAGAARPTAGSHFKNGPGRLPRVWSNTPSGVSDPTSSVVLIPLNAPGSEVTVSTPYGWVTLYSAPSCRPEARSRIRPKVICWPLAGRPLALANAASTAVTSGAVPLP